MSGVLKQLSAAGLLFLDSRTTPLSVAAQIPKQSNIRFATRDVFIDHDANPLDILAKLQRLEEIAKDQGTAIAIAHPYDVTLDILELWLESAPDRGFAIVPLTAIIKQRMAAPMRVALRN